eukprot:TRINITY_DN28698_c0_g1_i1.p1 TRINITY_DN28698_c0_g1~~TRINITY_DN28698_c0_g1_i1.p1  ORF type:complete len:664 (-),score=81.25 TRINITY_DN28698_c0_g1_i1:131-2122(-)
MPWQSHSFVTNVLFPCPTSSYTIDSFPGELIWVPLDLAAGDPAVLTRDDGDDGPGNVEGDSVPCLFLSCDSAAFLMIFFHSNAEDLGRCRWFCQWLRDQFQVHVLAVEYPGYGVFRGVASRESVVAAATAALHFVTLAMGMSMEQIIIFGRSIGTGPALALASRFRVGGVILVTPFLSIQTLFRERVGPLAWFVEELFPNVEEVPKIQSPTMFIHGRKDLLIPWQHSEALYLSCRARKIFVNPASMEHNTNLTSDVSLLIVPMFRFFPLPDYSFQEVKVPQWAFNKRRSPLYVRPKAEVLSRGEAPASVGDTTKSIKLPLGDHSDDVHVMEDAGVLTPLQQRGDSMHASSPEESAELLTHPTVLHKYSATKHRYSFVNPMDVRGSVDDGDLVTINAVHSFKPRNDAGLRALREPGMAQDTGAEEEACCRLEARSISGSEPCGLPSSQKTSKQLSTRWQPGDFCRDGGGSDGDDTDAVGGNWQPETAYEEESDVGISPTPARCVGKEVEMVQGNLDGMASYMRKFVSEPGKPWSKLSPNPGDEQSLPSKGISRRHNETETALDSDVVDHSTLVLTRANAGVFQMAPQQGLRGSKNVLMSCGASAWSGFASHSCASPFTIAAHCDCSAQPCDSTTLRGGIPASCHIGSYGGVPRVHGKPVIVEWE